MVPPKYDGPERRTVERFAVAMPVSIRQSGQRQLPATLTSLSPLGCSVSGLSLRAAETTVWVRIPGLESQPARRCWNITGAAGFVFEHPLHPAVARTLARPQPSASAPLPDAAPLSLVHDGGRSRSRREQILRGRATRGVDKRLERRFAPPAEALLGFRAAGRPAPLTDLSPSGIKVATVLPGGVGAEVKVSFVGYPPIAGQIVWVDQEATGLRLPAHSLDLFAA